MTEASADDAVRRFGAYVMERAFDPGMDSVIGHLEGRWRDDKSRDLSRRLNSLTADEREAVVAVARESVIAALHGLLHSLSHDEDRIRLMFEGCDVAALSDGLHGDLFFWMRHLSRHAYDWEAER